MMPLAALTVVLAVGALQIQSPPQPTTGAIKVVVRDAGSNAPLEGAEVTLEHAGKPAVTATTDLAGTIDFPDLEPGPYAVAVTYRNVPEGNAQTSELPPSQKQTTVKRGATSTLEFTIRRPATLRGQVLTAEGRPVSGAPIAVIPVGRTFRGRPVPRAAASNGGEDVTDAEGTFVVAGLNPGRYFVRASLPPRDNVPLNDVYAPGVISTAAAASLSVDSGDDITVGITAIAVPTVTVEGHVVDDAGRGIEGARIGLRPLDRDQEDAQSASSEITSDRDGRFVLKAVRVGTHAVHAIRQGGKDSVTLVGVTEVEVGQEPVRPPEIKVVPGALIAGQAFFNGAERQDASGALIRIRAEGDDAELRDGLAATTEWHPDGSFAISGVVGRHRLTLQSSGNWFIERAFLEDGTDVADAPFNFEPGRVYRKVRVLLSDETAEIVGRLPKGWDAGPIKVVAFPDDPTLWKDERYQKFATAPEAQTELTIRGVPPGRSYLVAVLVARRDAPLESVNPAEVLNELVPFAARVFVGEPGKFIVNLPDPRR